MPARPSQARRVAARKAAGLCIDCGEPVNPVATLRPWKFKGVPCRCAKCAGKIATARTRRIIAGSCGVCGKRPRRENRASCGPCAKAQTKNHNNFLAKKKKACIQAEPVVGSTGLVVAE